MRNNRRGGTTVLTENPSMNERENMFKFINIKNEKSRENKGYLKIKSRMKKVGKKNVKIRYIYICMHLKE